MITPILETECKRILLRPPEEADAEILYNNWLTDPNLLKSVDETTAWLTNKNNNYYWIFIYKEKNEIFGSGGIYYNDDCNKFEIRCNLMKKYWGSPLATETSTEMLKFAFDELNVKNFSFSYV